MIFCTEERYPSSSTRDLGSQFRSQPEVEKPETLEPRLFAGVSDIWAEIRSDWPQLVQILDFLRLVVVVKLTLKRFRFFPFGATPTQFNSTYYYVIPAWMSECEARVERTLRSPVSQTVNF